MQGPSQVQQNIPRCQNPPCSLSGFETTYKLQKRAVPQIVVSVRAILSGHIVPDGKQKNVHLKMLRPFSSLNALEESQAELDILECHALLVETVPGHVRIFRWPQFLGGTNMEFGPRTAKDGEI